METPIVYIAGPVSGQPDLNRDAFYEADQELKNKGFITRNPHEFCRHLQADSPSDPIFYRQGFAELVNCTDILLLPDWQYSRGATLEHHVAKLCRLRVHEGLKQLIDYFTNDEEG